MVTQSPTSSPLPPCWRDFEVYRLVKVDQLSTRRVAVALQLSQTRICQIVTRVDEYVGDLLVSKDGPDRRHRELLIAEQIAAEQVAALSREAMTAFRRSQESVVLVEKGEDGEEITRWKNPGEVRYLMAAARLALQQAKLPTPKLAFLGPGPDDEDEEYDGSEEARTESPPVGACSPPAAETAVKATASASFSPGNDDGETTCVSGVSAQLMAKLSSAAPVQSAQKRLPEEPETPPAKCSAPPTNQQQARRAFFQT